jgi:hypothetical protein
MKGITWVTAEGNRQSLLMWRKSRETWERKNPALCQLARNLAEDMQTDDPGETIAERMAGLAARLAAFVEAEPSFPASYVMVLIGLTAANLD